VVVNRRPIDESLVSVMLTPNISPVGRELTLRLMDHLVRYTQGVRVLVSQALEASLLAQGQLDAVITLESSGGWTRSAAMLLTEAAGGHVTELHDTARGRSGFLLSADVRFSRWLGEWFERNEISPVARGVEG
jgi:fructose-1,6-bisphosphatase/inositol monophosphatase family enzyme